MVNGRRERQQDITPGPSDYAPCRNDVMSRHRRQPVYVMSRADSAKRRQAQATVTPGTTDYTTFCRSRPAAAAARIITPPSVLSVRVPEGRFRHFNFGPDRVCTLIQEAHRWLFVNSSNWPACIDFGVLTYLLNGTHVNA